eukprot:820076-Rhodomonas_salina.2
MHLLVPPYASSVTYYRTPAQHCNTIRELSTAHRIAPYASSVPHTAYYAHAQRYAVFVPDMA